MTIHSIVEGHGEVEAVPVLLRKLLSLNNMAIAAGRPIRHPRSKIIQQSGLNDAIKIALKQHDCAMILIMIDADDDCPKELAPKMSEWAKAAAGAIPCEVVLATREYEAWFLASVESLRDKYLKPGACADYDPESVRGAKERLAHLMVNDGPYIEKKHQAAMSELFDLNVAFQKSRSFKRLVKAFGNLCGVADVKLSY